MFRVKDTILSEDVATARFACDVSRCKGACCVVGNAGAPVDKEEIPILRKAFRLLKDELRSEAVQAVEEKGVVWGDQDSGFEISCVEEEACIFVIYNTEGVAECAIQKAYYEGRISWEKPISCHMFPIRLKRIIDFDYANFEYIPDICGSGCAHGEQQGIWLSDFLQEPLIRRYGEEWYDEFMRACIKVREQESKIAD